MQRLTRVNVGDPQHVALTDEKLFDYPWVYATQTGYWNLSDAETAKLGEFLQRGGFLMTDDFWEHQEYQVFAEAMNRVLPGQPITDIGLDGFGHARSLRHPAEGSDVHSGVAPFGTRRNGLPAAGHQVRLAGAMYDPKNRMVVAVNFNTDIGDAWEFADVPYYPEAMTTLAYHYGINYLIYSMTH